VKREFDTYNLDAIISVGYRVNSTKATRFRIWATTTLKKYLLEGYAINPQTIEIHYDAFQEAVEKIRVLTSGKEREISHDDTMALVQLFASTWVSLDAYDKSELPTTGTTLEVVEVSASELDEAIKKLK